MPTEVGIHVSFVVTIEVVDAGPPAFAHGRQKFLLDLRDRPGFNDGMTPGSLLNDDWTHTNERLGGAEALAIGARKAKAFAWGRKIPSPAVLLRLVLAYRLGEWGLRSTTAWATAIGLADISNVAFQEKRKYQRMLRNF
jgi:hypothetical protein